MAAPKITTPNPLMSKEFVNSFIEAVVKTHSLMAQTQILAEKPIVETKKQSRGEIAGMIGMVAGPLKGTLTISYQKDAILKVIENMLGEKHSEINSTVSDAVGELTNQIYGAAKTEINKTGYNFEMAIPTIVQGSFKISNVHHGATLVIPFSLGSGEKFFAELTIETS